MLTQDHYAVVRNNDYSFEISDLELNFVPDMLRIFLSWGGHERIFFPKRRERGRWTDKPTDRYSSNLLVFSPMHTSVQGWGQGRVQQN